MSVRLIRSEENSSSQRADRLWAVVLNKVREAQIQEQIPLAKAKPYACPIFADLVRDTSGHAVSKPR